MIAMDRESRRYTGSKKPSSSADATAGRGAFGHYLQDIRDHAPYRDSTEIRQLSEAFMHTRDAARRIQVAARLRQVTAQAAYEVAEAAGDLVAATNARAELAVATDEEAAAVATEQQICTQIVKANLSLIIACAKRFPNCDIEMEDLVQIGNEGSLKAVQLFDADRGIPFGSYLYSSVYKLMIRAIRDRTRLKRKGYHISLDDEVSDTLMSGDATDRRMIQIQIRAVFDRAKSDGVFTDREAITIENRLDEIEITDGDLGVQWGVSRSRVGQIRASADAKLRLLFPEYKND